MFLFGIAIFAIEAKDIAKSKAIKDFIYTWFPFTTIVGGKGTFMLIAGSVGLGFGSKNYLLAIPGICSMVLGAVYIIMHLTKSKKLTEMYDVSMFIHANNLDDHAV